MGRWLVAVALGLLALVLLVAWQVGWLADLGLVSRGAPGTEEGALLEAGTSDPAASADRASLAGREGTKSVLPAAPAPITGPRVTGRVVDASSRGLANARVISLPDTNTKTARFDEFGKEGGAGLAAITDAEGRFVVAVSKEAPFHFVAAHASGFAPTLLPSVAPGADVVITLEPPRTLAGTVKDRDGNGIAGARVRALLLVDTIRVELEARSAADGSYRLEGVPPERKRDASGWIGYFESGWFEVTGDGFAPLFAEAVLASLTGSSVKRDFILLRGATLAGVVEDAETGKRVPGATVALYSTEGMTYFHRSGGQAAFGNPYVPRVLARLQAGEDGSFRVEHVPSTVGAQLIKSRLGAVGAWAAGYTTGSHDLELPADGATVEVTLKLWPAATLTGRTVSAAGQPVSGVRIGVQVEGREQKSYLDPVVEGPPRAWSTTGGDGRFLLDGVPVTRAGSTTATLRAYAPRPRQTPGREGGDANREITVKAGESLDVGDLVLAADEPPPTTTVRVVRPDGTPYFGALVDRGGWGNGPRTDADGRVGITWPKPKEGETFPAAEVIARARGFAPTPARVPAPGPKPELVEVTLLPGHRLAGRVSFADGTPAAGVSVVVADGSLKAEELFAPERGNEQLVGQMQPTRGRVLPAVYGMVYAAADGAFRFEDLPDGPYHVRATTDRRVGGAKRLVALAGGVAADGEVALRFPVDDSPATGSVKVTVTDASTGKVLLGVSVLMKRGIEVVASTHGAGGTVPAPPGMRAPVDPSGALTLPVVPVGSYLLEVSADGFRPTRVEGVEVRENEATSVPAVTLERGIAVVGRIAPPAGLEVKDRLLTFQQLGVRDTPRYLTSTVAADGTFRVTGFEPGRYRATAQAPFGVGAQPAPLLPAANEELVLNPGDTEVRFDPAWAAAANIVLQPDDARLPPAPWNQERGPATEDQKKFGAATRVVLRGADGKVFVDVTGARRMDVGHAGWQTLLPGIYTARIEFPGGESREETVDLKAGARAEVYFRKR